MTVFLTIVRRELGGYFFSLTGYVVIAAVLFLLGFGFLNLLIVLDTEASHIPLRELFFQTAYFWMVLLLATPLITMRTYSQEKYSGTYETLMTTSVSDVQVVLAKFVGSLVFYVAMWIPLIGCLALVRNYTGDTSALAFGTTASTYLGIFLIGSVFVAIGCFSSALTESQMIAAIISFSLGVTLFLLSFLSPSISVQSTWMTELAKYISMTDHMYDFARGVVDTRHIMFYLSLTIIFLFFNCKVVEARRWK